MQKIVERKWLTNALDKLGKELSVVPQEVIDAAYDYRDFLVRHLDHDFTKIFDVRVYEAYGLYRGGGVDRRFEITIEVETHNTYHNDTETNRTISIKETNNIFPASFEHRRLPWERQ